MEIQNTRREFRWLPAAIALVQLFDIVIHAVSGMIEPIRVIANVVLLIWLGIVVSGRLNHMAWRVATGSVGVYLLLNAVFLATAGFTNPDDGGQFRTVLVVLVGMSVALAAWLTITTANRER